MRYVRQLDISGCGPACIAMLAGVGYKKVKAIGNKLKLWENTTPYYSTTRIMYKLGQKVGLKISKRINRCFQQN